MLNKRVWYQNTLFQKNIQIRFLRELSLFSVHRESKPLELVKELSVIFQGFLISDKSTFVNTNNQIGLRLQIGFKSKKMWSINEYNLRLLILISLFHCKTQE